MTETSVVKPRREVKLPADAGPLETRWVNPLTNLPMTEWGRNVPMPDVKDINRGSLSEAQRSRGIKEMPGRKVCGDFVEVERGNANIYYDEDLQTNVCYRVKAKSTGSDLVLWEKRPLGSRGEWKEWNEVFAEGINPISGTVAASIGRRLNAAMEKDIKEGKFVVGGALRDNGGKPKLMNWLLFSRSAEAMSRVLEYGEEKYAAYNYTKGGKPDEEYLSAAMRHLVKHCRYYITKNKDDMYDEESGCLHVAHALWNLMMLFDYNHTDMPLRKE